MVDAFNEEEIVEYAKEIMTSCVIKNNAIFNFCEKDEYASAYRKYKNAYFKLDRITSYVIPKDVLSNYSLPDDVIDAIYSNTGLIYDYLTSEEIDLLLTDMRDSVVNGYVEKNEYVKELMGLPYNEAQNITLDSVFDTDNINLCHKYNISTNVYIHLLSDVDINILNTTYIYGSTKTTMLQYLIDNIKYAYISYLPRRVHLTAIREASDYDLIYVDCVSSEKFLYFFKTNYDICKLYYKTVLRNVFFERQFNNFEFLIHMYLIFSATTLAQMDYSNLGLDFDYTNKKLLDLLFKDNGMEFLDLPELMTRRIFENIVDLKRYKGSRRCLTIIKNIFEINNIFRYVLHKAPSYDDDGNVTYRMFFYKIPFDAKRITPYINNSENRVKFHDIVDKDPLWGTTSSKMYEKLIESDISLIETKYLSIDLLNDIFEYTMDYSALLHNIMLYKDITDIGDIRYCRGINFSTSIFELTIYMLCLRHINSLGMSTKNPHVGNEKKMIGMMCNLSSDKCKQLIHDIKYNFKLDDTRIQLLLSYLNLYELSFSNQKEMYIDMYRCLHVVDTLEEMINEQSDARCLQVLKDMYSAITIVTNIADEAFTINDVVYDDYVTYLSAKNENLYNRYLELLGKEESATKFNSIINEYTYVLDLILNSINPYNDELLGEVLSPLRKDRDYRNSSLNESIYELIKYFISYTAELMDFSDTISIGTIGTSYMMTHTIELEFWEEKCTKHNTVDKSEIHIEHHVKDSYKNVIYTNILGGI